MVKILYQYFTYLEKADEGETGIPTDEFEREDTMRHGPFDIILVCSCVVITRQQIYLPHTQTK